MEYDVIVKQALNGISLVLFLILIAMGLSVIFGMMRIINMAHGDLFMLGAYTLYAVQSAGLNFWVGMVTAPLVVVIVGLAMERSVLRYLYGRQDISTLLATWGFGVIFRQGIQLVFGADLKFVQAPAPLQGTLIFFGIAYPVYRLFAMVVAALIILGVLILFFKTNFGIMSRATIQNREMSAVLGIDTQRMFLLSFILGSALAGISGALMAPIISVISTMGLDFLARSFFAVIIGGMGSIFGVLGGGFIVGETESIFSIFFIPTVAQTVVLLMVIVVVLLMPKGLFKT